MNWQAVAPDGCGTVLERWLADETFAGHGTGAHGQLKKSIRQPGH
jgi:hypothetical protein